MNSYLYEGDWLDGIKQIKKNSVNLILTDIPYNISKDSNFNKGEDKKFSNINLNFGDWDKEIDLNLMMGEFKRVLKTGGTMIIFYDIWKMNELKKIANELKLNQHRIGCWVKNNPTPINSSNNYLSNAVEYFAVFVKYRNNTFNSQYDKGLYFFPKCQGKEKTEHPTQKPKELFKELILKHSNIKDVVLDPFVGSGTTIESCIETDRVYIAFENKKEYIDIINKRIFKNE